MERSAKQAGYEIRVRGVLGDTLLAAFPGLDARTEDGITVLIGSMLDQAGLHGVLNAIEALGLELVEVRRKPEPDDRVGCSDLTTDCSRRERSEACREARVTRKRP
jgi:hypothetical protein